MTSGAKARSGVMISTFAPVFAIGRVGFASRVDVSALVVACRLGLDLFRLARCGLVQVGVVRELPATPLVVIAPACHLSSPSSRSSVRGAEPGLMSTAPDPLMIFPSGVQPSYTMDS